MQKARNVTPVNVKEKFQMVNCRRAGGRLSGASLRKLMFKYLK